MQQLGEEDIAHLGFWKYFQNSLNVVKQPFFSVLQEKLGLDLTFNCLTVIIVLLYLFMVVRVWNEAVAHRLTTLGHSARRGDLVWMQEGQKKLEDTGETSSPQVREVNRAARIPLNIRFIHLYTYVQLHNLFLG